MCLYEAQISGERLQDHWSSGFAFVKLNLLALIKSINAYDMSLLMRKPAFCICKNKDAD